MNDDNLNQNNMSLDNQNVFNPQLNNTGLQDNGMMNSIPEMNEGMDSTQVAPSEPTQSEPIIPQPQYTSIYGDIATTIVQPDVSQMNTNVPNTQETSVREKKPKSKNGILIAIIILLVALVAGAYVYLKFFSNISHNVYQITIEKGIGNIFDKAHDDSAFQYEMSLNVKIDTADEIIPQELRDLINKININSIVQVDKTSHTALIKLDSTDSKALLKADVYAELNGNKAYVSLPDYLDKYIEVEDADFSELTDAIDKKYDYKTIEKVLKREMVKIVKDEECTREEGYYVWKVSNKELTNRLVELVNTLKNDSEFVTAMGGKEEVEKLFDTSSVSTIDSGETYDITFKLNEEAYEISFEDYVFSGTISDDTVTFKASQAGNAVLNGSVTLKGTDDNYTINFKLSSGEFGSIEVNMSNKYSKITSIEAIDKTKAVKAEELTAEDQQQLMGKLQESELYSIISSYALGTSEDDPDDTIYYEYEYNFE